MHSADQPAYGLWFLVILNSAIFIIFAFSFTKPKSKTDWRSLGAFSAFILALFTEMQSHMGMMGEMMKGNMMGKDMPMMKKMGEMQGKMSMMMGQMKDQMNGCMMGEEMMGKKGKSKAKKKRDCTEFCV